jgi:hypothetical protein
VSELTSILRLALFSASTVWAWGGELPTAVVSAASAALTYVPHLLDLSDSVRQKTALGVTCYVSLHTFLGIGVGLYEFDVGFDKALHVIGFGAFTAFLLRRLSRFAAANGFTVSPWLAITAAFAVSLGGGAAWEIFEYAIDRSSWFTSQRGLHDTMLDLIANALGALVVVVVFMASRALSDRFVF